MHIFGQRTLKILYIFIKNSTYPEKLKEESSIYCYTSVSLHIKHLLH